MRKRKKCTNPDCVNGYVREKHRVDYCDECNPKSRVYQFTGGKSKNH